MPTKYQCQVCSRCFVHKETLKEHKLLHGLAVIDGNKFSCPICQHEVICQSGIHEHGSSHCNSNSQTAKCHQSESSDMAVAENVCINSEGEGIKLRLKNRNPKYKDTDVTNASGGVSCRICNRSFVYQKCLQKHTALVHGLLSEDSPKAETKTDDLDVLQQKDDAVMNDNFSSPNNSQDAIKNVSSDGGDSVLENTKEIPCDVQLRKIIGETGVSSELKVDPSDVKCKTCLKQFRHKAMLLRHMHMIHGETDFERCICPLCSQKFCSQLSFSNHFVTEHKAKAAEVIESLADGQTGNCSSDGTSGIVDVALCKECNQWFSCQQSFQRHCSLKHRSNTRELYHKSANSSEPTDINLEDMKPCSNRTHHGNSEPLVSVNVKAEFSDSGSSSDKTVHNVPDDQSHKLSKYFCTICSKTFVNMNFLDRHIRLKHSSPSDESLNSARKLECKTRKQTFVCGYCSEEFSKENSLTEHVESCHKGIGVDSAECTCPVCGCSCPSQWFFSVHYKTLHYVNAASYESSMSDLTDESVNNPVRRCSVCELWFTSEQVLRDHHCTKQVLTRHPPKTGRARYRCKQCGEAFEILRCFLHHRKTKHRVVGPDKTDDEVTSVPLTQTAVPAVNGLAATMSQRIRGQPIKSDDGLAKEDDSEKQNDSVEEQQHVSESCNALLDGAGLSCPECSRVFPTIALLRRHRKSEHRNRTCQLCGETCKSADMVYYHNLKYHHEQKCEVCGASCSGRVGLIDHFRAQHPTEPPPLINRKTLICEYCPRVFAGCASRLLRDHIESCHLGRVHLCDVCGKRLGSAQTLAVHRRMHDPVARFECRECNRRFPHNTNLMNHIRKHHPERLPAKYVREFRCDVCLMQFGSSSGLSRHKSEKHGSQRFQCDLCLRVFPSVTGLRVHKRRDHQPKEMSPASVPVRSSPVAAAKTISTPPPAAPHVVAQLATDPTNAIMAGFMANVIGLPGLGQTFQ